MHVLRPLTVLFALLILASPLPAQPASDGPEAIVDRLESTLIELMKAGDSMSFEQRFDELRPLMDETFAAERMARYIFGRDWSGFDAERRTAFLDAFLDLSAATYAAQFNAWNGEHFDPVEVQQQSEDRALVKHVLTTSERKVSFDYLLMRSDAGWRVVTIIADGVSDLALKRSQYRRILQQDDFAAVIAHVREQVAKQSGD